MKERAIGALPGRLLLNNGPGAAASVWRPSCLPIHQNQETVASGLTTFTTSDTSWYKSVAQSYKLSSVLEKSGVDKKPLHRYIY